MNYATKATSKRGCGFRSGGGLYMVTGGEAMACGLLPIELTTCPTCGGGIKQTRSFQWVNPTALLGIRDDKIWGMGSDDVPYSDDHCGLGCLQCWKLWGDKSGLLWIGAAYYEMPEDWLKEAHEQGVSRRISAVPTDFVIGEHWILAGHPKACRVDCEPCHGTGSIQDGSQERCEACNGTGASDYRRGIFAAFKPTGIERVLTQDEKALLDEHAYLVKHKDELKSCDPEAWVKDLTPKNAKTWAMLERLVKKGVKLVDDRPIPDGPLNVE